ncbi:MAG: pyridoxal phosphate enzyme (YggS family) [Myxococcota bacterium]|jgi:pyridoxal phosphate enzyme (YggS family)
MTITDRLAVVRERVAQATADAGRSPQDVHLIAVSKTQPASAIREAYAAGQRHFGESYAQELAQKAAELADLTELHWHFIGTIQTNKAGLIAPVSERVHAVHSARHARALAKKHSPIQVLLAVNLGDEDSKTGVPAADVLGVCAQMNQTEGVQLRGLMTLPPNGKDPTPFFTELASLAQQGRAAGLPLTELSMGMSGDFEVAISLGANWVRVGTAVFGPRQPRQ